MGLQTSCHSPRYSFLLRYLAFLLFHISRTVFFLMLPMKSFVHDGQQVYTLPDVVTSNKKGVYYFRQTRK